LDVFGDTGWKDFRGAGLGLLCNQASLDRGLRPGPYVVAGVLPGALKAIFGPQHGYGGEDQDNMVETGHGYHPELRVPIFSLYADKREPTAEMLETIDVLLVDLQDVGTRVYTFPSTLLNCMRAAAASGCRVVVLDRPNPIGGSSVEGNLLAPDMHSFVGPAAIPMRHGMTMGELALFFKGTLAIDVDLDVVRMAGWGRQMFWKDTGLTWVMPSPNMPAPETALVYPGQVLWEGTNVSEGRGTCRPFEMFGAPFLHPGRILSMIPEEVMNGAFLLPFSFRPTFHKHAERICRGFFIHVLNERLFQPYVLSLALLQAVMRDGRDAFAWREPPYEYETERLPIDLILGSGDLRRALENGHSPQALQQGWREELVEFEARRRPFLIYAD
jgi:uncharacterized protein YbbC (DUF1343 family)